MRASLLVFSCAFLCGCATRFEPAALPPNHPASVQAEEAPRSPVKRLSGSDELTRKTLAVYTCVMHPEVQQHAPGNCPKCGMSLVLKK